MLKEKSYFYVNQSKIVQTNLHELLKQTNKKGKKPPLWIKLFH
jgi:hypothetical protein